MTPRTLFTIILKVIGIYLVYQLFILVPMILAQIPIMTMGQANSYMYVTIIIVVGFLYFLLMRLILFKTAWIIDKLALDKHFEQEIIEININSSVVIQIATIMVGGALLIDAIPSFFKQIIFYLQQKETENFLTKDPQFGFVVLWGCKILLGYLLITNSKRITRWMEKKSDAQNSAGTSSENQEE